MRRVSMEVRRMYECFTSQDAQAELAMADDETGKLRIWRVVKSEVVPVMPGKRYNIFFVVSLCE